MTGQRTDGASSADPANTYLQSLGERLTADKCRMTASNWGEHPVVIGSRSDRKARWFGTKVELFVFAAVVPGVDDAHLAEFTKWAMSYAQSCRSGLPGARNAMMVLPALISGGVHTSAREWASRDARVLGTTVIGRPLTVEAAQGVSRVTMYRGGTVWGGMFTRHVLEKASLYFP
ncbi:hypothetical protein AB0M94_03385 [Streptomyces xanthochromogenes]|uniref:Uncharacterized protein n=1 Tax=Streptomyces xanthochromogenes TaxID=67384 RepID=A0ABQ2ZJC0_9ACTN|nr:MULTISPECIES: hypothetical protein [Streptomyces]MYV94525.1 hypothetical protein [Streptomyces sp. SID1034]GGY18019.1 hypothetical protein GCM10010326_08200 [Streptomyces xanthochromogenes]